MIILPEEKKENNIYLLSGDSRFKLLEQNYIVTRKEEGRLYPDKILAQLPAINRSHQLYHEWKLREASMKSLIKYFNDNIKLEILDLGCGNCWLANQLSIKTENFVCAVDINMGELEQGAGVFSNNNRLQFIYADIFENILPQNSFDAVLISSSIQYFKDLRLLIDRLLNLLNFCGEIHIIDSNFYKANELKEAMTRTEIYYNKLGHPEMIQYYHHHCWEELDEFNYQILNKNKLRIGKVVNRVFQNNFSPFPWIRIKAKDN
jgi:ubiquinone/menaquinone biosynthesis C-methylase UbiE